MFKKTLFAALLALALAPSSAMAGSDDEANDRFIEGVSAIQFDALLAGGTTDRTTAQFMLANSGNLRAIVVGCDDTCRGIRLEIRAAGLTPLAMRSNSATPRVGIFEVPDAYRRSFSNLEIDIIIDCPQERRCTYRWGAMSRGPAVSPRHLSSAEWTRATETVTGDEIQWRQRPTAEDLRFYYPVDAWRTNRSGAATLDCVVQAGGALVCRVREETPARQGFGEAARRLSSLLRLDTESATGGSLVGRRIVVPIRFEPGG